MMCLHLLDHYDSTIQCPQYTAYTDTSWPSAIRAKSALRNLSISWSGTSPQHVTSYIVFWWKESSELGSSVTLYGNTYNIEGLDSNTKYEVMVQAVGTFGNINSTIKVFYTTPNEMKGNILVIYMSLSIQCSSNCITITIIIIYVKM